MNKLLELGVIKTVPKKWTKEEIDRVLELKNKNLTSSEIATILDRSQVSVSIKLKRLTKQDKTYNDKHRQDKYLTNEKFIFKIQPKTVLDVYAADSFYKKYDDLVVVDNDSDTKYETAFNMDSFDLLCLMKLHNKKFDIVDLDPYGSSVDCFDIAIKLAKKGIVITLGEMGHKRWKRLDFVRRWYGIETMEDFTVDKIILELQKIASRNKKHIEPVYIKEYNRIARVWFEVSNIKITEQWDKEN
jgi:hypothetical protein